MKIISESMHDLFVSNKITNSANSNKLIGIEEEKIKKSLKRFNLPWFVMIT